MLDLLGAIVLVLLTMVSYSSGITLAARRRTYPVSVVDLLLVVGLWLLVFWLRPNFSRWPMIGLTILVGLMVGFLIGTMRLASQTTSQAMPESELPEHAREQVVTAVARNPLKRLWQRWSNFAERMGTVQGRLFMGFFYFFIVTPFGLIGRLFTDSLAIKHTPAASNWHSKEADVITIDAAREQG